MALSPLAAPAAASLVAPAAAPLGAGELAGAIGAVTSNSLVAGDSYQPRSFITLNHAARSSVFWQSIAVMCSSLRWLMSSGLASSGSEGKHWLIAVSSSSHTSRPSTFPVRFAPIWLMLLNSLSAALYSDISPAAHFSTRSASFSAFDQASFSTVARTREWLTKLRVQPSNRIAAAATAHGFLSRIIRSLRSS